MLAIWSFLGVRDYVEDRITYVSLDTEPCEVIEGEWAGCVFPDTGVVHAKWYYGPLFWTWGMVHEAAHVQQYREGWPGWGPETERDADRRGIEVFRAGIFGE
jgi:hypothetical protein